MKRSIYHGVAKLLAMMLIMTLLPLTASPARSQDPLSPPVIPDPPVPMPIPPGSPPEQAIAFADAMDTTPDNVAAWLGLYDALDIPVIAPDGTSLGVENSDPIGPAYWEVWYTSAATPVIGLSLADFGQLVALALEDTTTDYGALLLQDIRESAVSTDPHSQLLALFVAERMTRGSRSPLDETTTPDQVTVDAAVMLLLGWEMIRAGVLGMADQSAAIPSHADAAFKLARNPSSGSPTQVDFGSACADGSTPNDVLIDMWTQWSVQEINADGRAFANALQNITKQLASQFTDAPGTNGADLRQTMRAGYLLAMLLAGFQFEISASPAPFLRTKSQGEWGESSDVKMTLKFTLDSLPSGDLRMLCATYLVTKSFGGSFNVPPDGPVNGGHLISTLVKSADRVGFVDDRALENNIRLYGTTDDSGQVTTTIKGRPQPYEIPETAAKVDMEYGMIVVLDLEELAGLDGSRTLTLGATTILQIPAGADSPLIQALDQMRSRFRLGRYQFSFQDWQPQMWRAILGSQPTETVVCDFTEPMSINANVLDADYAIDLTPQDATSGTVFMILSYAGTAWFEVTGTYSLTFVEQGGLQKDYMTVDMQITEVCGLQPTRICAGVPSVEPAELMFDSIGPCEWE